MNLPIEICAIIEDYLPLQFDCESLEHLSDIANYYSNHDDIFLRPREIELRTLVTGFGSKAYKIKFTWCVQKDFTQFKNYKLFQINWISHDKWCKTACGPNSILMEVYYYNEKNKIDVERYLIEFI